jgi:hypothetical protein
MTLHHRADLFHAAVLRTFGERVFANINGERMYALAKATKWYGLSRVGVLKVSQESSHIRRS